MAGLNIKHVIEAVVRPTLDKTSEANLRKELNDLFSDTSIDFNGKEFKDSLKSIVDAFNSVFTQVGKQQIDLGKMIQMPGKEAWSELGRIAATDFMDGWKSVMQGVGAPSKVEIDFGLDEQLKKLKSQRQELVKEYEEIEKQLTNKTKIKSINDFDVVNAKAFKIDDTLLKRAEDLQGELYDLAYQIEDLEEGTIEYIDAVLDARKKYDDYARMQKTLKQAKSQDKNLKIPDDIRSFYDLFKGDDRENYEDRGGNIEAFVDSYEGQRILDAYEKIDDVFEDAQDRLEQIKYEITGIDSQIEELGKSAVDVIKPLKEIEEAYNRIKNKDGTIKSSMRKAISSAINYNPDDEKELSLTQLFKRYNDAGLKGADWEQQYVWLVKFVKEYEDYITKNDISKKEDFGKYTTLYEQLKPMATEAESMLQNVLDMSAKTTSAGGAKQHDVEGAQQEAKADEVSAEATQKAAEEAERKAKAEQDAAEAAKKAAEEAEKKRLADEAAAKAKKESVNATREEYKAYRAVQDPSASGKTKKEALEDWGGQYWATDKRVPISYAEDHEGKSDILVGTIKPTNPLVIEANGLLWDDFANMPGLKELFPGLVDILKQNDPYASQKYINEQAKMAGFDAVIFKNVRDAIDADINENAPIADTIAVLNDSIVSLEGSFSEISRERVPGKGWDKQFSDTPGDIPSYYEYGASTQIKQETVAHQENIETIKEETAAQEQLNQVKKESVNLDDADILEEIKQENGTLEEKLDRLQQLSDEWGYKISQKKRDRYEELNQKDMDEGLTTAEENRMSELYDEITEADNALEEFGDTYEKIVLKLANGKKVEIFPDDKGLSTLYKVGDEYGESYNGVEIEDVVFERKKKEVEVQEELNDVLEKQQQIEQKSDTVVADNQKKIKSYEDLKQALQEYHDTLSNVKRIEWTERDEKWLGIESIRFPDDAMGEPEKYFKQQWKRVSLIKKSIKDGADSYIDPELKTAVRIQENTLENEMQKLEAYATQFALNVDGFSDAQKKFVDEINKRYDKWIQQNELRHAELDKYNKPYEDKAHEIDSLIEKQLKDPNDMKAYQTFLRELSDVKNYGVTEQSLKVIGNLIGIEIPQSAEIAKHAVDGLNTSLEKQQQIERDDNLSSEIAEEKAKTAAIEEQNNALRENIELKNQIGNTSHSDTPSYSAMSRDEATGYIAQNYDYDVWDNWYSKALDPFRTQIAQTLESDIKLRNAALNQMWDEYKHITGSDVSFEEFLNTKIPLFRGESSDSKSQSEKALSFTMSQDAAKDFGENVLKVWLRPMDTLGMANPTYTHQPEAEVLIPKELVTEYEGWRQKLSNQPSVINQTEPVDASTGALDAETLKSVLSSIIYNVQIAQKHDAPDSEKSSLIDTEALKTVLNSITYNAKIVSDDADKNANKIAIDESALESTLNRVFGNILNPVTEQNDGNVQEPWAREDTLGAVKGVLDTIQTNTAKIGVVESKQVATVAADNALATESTLTAIKTAVESINSKVVKGTKASVGGGKKQTETQETTVTVPNTDSKASGGNLTERIKTAVTSLLKYKTVLQEANQLSGDLEVGINSLSTELGQVTDKASLAVWNEHFKQFKNGSSILQTLAKDYRALGEMQAKADNETDPTKLSQYLDNLQILQDRIAVKQVDVNVDDGRFESVYQRAYNITRHQIQQKEELAQATKQESDELTQQANVVSTLKKLYTELGTLQERAGATSDVNLASQYKSEVDEVLAKIQTLRQSLKDITPELEKEFSSRTFDAAQKEANAQYRAMAKADTEDEETRRKKILAIEKEIGKLKADADSASNSGVKGTIEQEIQFREHLIDLQKQGLTLDADMEAYQRRRLALLTKEAKEKERAEKADIKDVFKEREKALRKEIAQNKKEAGLGLASSALNSGRKTIGSLWQVDGVDATQITSVVELDKALEDLSKTQFRISQQEGPVSKEDTVLLQTQTNKVALYTQEVKDLIANFQRFSGDNTKDIGSFVDGADIETQLRNAVAAATNGKAQIKSYNNETQELTYTVKTGANTFTEYTAGVRQADKALVSVKGTTKQTEKFFDSFKRKLSEIFRYFSASSLIYKAFNELRKGIQYIKEIDLALVELRKVTDETEETYDEFLNTAAKTADKLGSTISQVTEATATFAKLGYTMETAAEMAEAAIVYKNVGDNIASTEDAADSIISTLKGFGLEASESMRIVDRFNEVGNRFAITSQGLGEALRLSASALNEGGNTLDESIGIITAANEVVNDPSSVGTALKTLTLRLRGAKTELEEAGLDIENMATTTSQLQAKLLALTGGQVDIMLDANTFKSSTQILREMAAAWEDMTDIQQAAALELMGGRLLPLRIEICA